jgi:large subunit ribosomal protein L31
MKKDIHPEYKMITVRLADGTEFQTRSTMDTETYASEVDSTNHPFYTGRRQYVDTAGRVEKFRRRYGIKSEASEATEATESEG